MGRKLAVALLGCGSATRFIHFPVLTKLNDVELVAIAESDPQRRAEAATLAPGASVFESYDDLLAGADVEAAVVALPNALHVPAAVAAFERGLHVYIEKPIATDLESARPLLSAWRAAGTTAMVGYNYRFHPMHESARQRMARGEIGSVVSLRSVFSISPRNLPEWKRQRQSGGGALLDLASHHLDLAGWLVGAAPVAVSCSQRSMRSDDDCAWVELEFASGVRCQTMVSLAAVDDDRFEVYGDAGRIVMDRHRSDRVETHPATLERVRALRLGHAARAFASPAYWRSKLTRGGPEVSYWRALGEFAAAALAGRPASPDLLDGWRGLAVLEAARRSAEGRRRECLEGTDFEAPAGW